MTRAGIDSRERILNAAGELFAVKGFAAVSMRDVGKAVKMTPATLYHHFDGKEALYKAVLAHVFSTRAADIRDIVSEGHSCDAHSRLETLLAFMSRLLLEEEVLAQLLRRELIEGDPEKLQYLAKELLQDLFDDLHAFAKQLSARMRSDRFTLYAMSLVFGFCELQKLSRHLNGADSDTGDPERFARESATLLLYGASTADKAGG